MTSDRARILIVDDDPSVTTSLSLLLKQGGFAARAAATPAAAREAAAAWGPDLVIQDMNFSRATTGEEGLALLRELRGARPALPVILLTAWGSIALAVEGMKSGATDFMTKPWDNEHMMRVVRTALRLARPASATPADRESLDEAYDFAAILGREPSLLRVLEVVARVARTDAGVLLLGESGTGKELVADAIHANGDRRDGPLVKVNLGAVTASLFESEMFGHVRGAFTDARRDRRGRLAEADGGTLFLDEIGELERSAQVKLLRALQDRTFQPVGSDRTLRSDFRVVAATNRDLEALVAAGAFREDLYYRLNLITLRLPPLRDRRGDIPLIAGHHLREVRARHDLPEIELAADALQWLVAQPWPGNVRQLKHTVERTVLLAAKRVLTRRDFEAFLPTGPERPARTPWPPVGEMTLEEVERAMICRALDQFDHNVTRAAEALGLSRAALYRRLDKHGLSG